MIYHVKPINKQSSFLKELENDDNDFEVTNILCDTVLSLPMHLYPCEEYIVNIEQMIKNFLSKNICD